VGQAVIDVAELERAYDTAFAARAPSGLRVRPEAETDEPFLRELSLATFHLRDVLPPPLLAQQIDFRVAAFRSGFPGAMRRIALESDGPVGRIIIDWRHGAGASHCADVAVRPSDGGRGLGTALLRAWTEVAARHGLVCTLNVEPNNPARALYVRLGFREAPAEFESPGVAMSRPPGGGPA
jgi:ribosomal protein S18 acetylase RimI-like enzyme